MPSFHIIEPLRRYTDGQSDVRVQGETIGEALSGLVTQYPRLRSYLFTEGGDDLRTFIMLLVNGRQVRYFKGDETRLHEGDCLTFIPLINGG